MKVKNPLIKRAIHEILRFTGEVNLQGLPVERASYPEGRFKNVRSVLSKIETDFLIRYEIVTKKDGDKKDNVETKFCKQSEFKPEMGEPKNTTYGNDELVFSDIELATIAFYAKRDDVPAYLMPLTDEEMKDYQCIITAKQNVSKKKKSSLR